MNQADDKERRSENRMRNKGRMVEKPIECAGPKGLEAERLMTLHPEWSRKEVAAAIGCSEGVVMTRACFLAEYGSAEQKAAVEPFLARRRKAFTYMAPLEPLRAPKGEPRTVEEVQDSNERRAARTVAELGLRMHPADYTMCTQHDAPARLLGGNKAWCSVGEHQLEVKVGQTETADDADLADWPKSTPYPKRARKAKAEPEKPWTSGKEAYAQARERTERNLAVSDELLKAANAYAKRTKKSAVKEAS